eukprot:m.1067301 g.1067301  ORF g.1067301 m.1067301 type:complete len:2652 (+) comp24222_c0_seq2:51-8006(+)
MSLHTGSRGCKHVVQMVQLLSVITIISTQRASSQESCPSLSHETCDGGESCSGLANTENRLCMADASYDFSSFCASLSPVRTLSNSSCGCGAGDISSIVLQQGSGISSFCQEQYFDGNGFKFSLGEGLAINTSCLISNKTRYTVRIQFQFDTDYSTQRVLNVQNDSSHGLFTYYSQLRPSTYARYSPSYYLRLYDDYMYDLFLTVDGSTVSAYLNSSAYGYTSTTWTGVSQGFNITGDYMYFFNDLGMTCSSSGRHSSGTVKAIQIWDSVLSEIDVDAHMYGCDESGMLPPEPTPISSVANPENKLCMAHVTYDFSHSNATTWPVDGLSASAVLPQMTSISDRASCPYQSGAGINATSASYSFMSGDGMYIPNIQQVMENATTTYTLRMQFSFTNGHSGRSRVLNVNYPSTYGLFVDTGYYLYPQARVGAFHNGVYNDFFFVVNGSRVTLYTCSGNTTILVYSSYQSYQIVTETMLFFNDYNPRTCGTSSYQHAGGQVKFIQLWNRALSQDEVESARNGCDSSGAPLPRPISPPVTPEPLSCGQTVTGTTRCASHYTGTSGAEQAYLITVDANSTGLHTFSSCGSDLDTALTLYRGVWPSVASVDRVAYNYDAYDGDCYYQARLDVTITTPGTYSIVIESESASYEGDYTLTYICPDSSTCAAGQFYTRTATPGNCTSCASGTYVNSTAHQNTSCLACDVCPPQKVQTVACDGVTRNVTCKYCIDHPACGRVEPVRLVDGSSRYNGRLEVFVNGSWATVSRSYMSTYDYQAACRQLYMAGGSSYYYGGVPAGTSGHTANIAYHCSGGEPSLQDCSQAAMAPHNQTLYDTFMACSPPTNMTFGTSQPSGRTEADVVEQALYYVRSNTSEHDGLLCFPSNMTVSFGPGASCLMTQRMYDVLWNLMNILATTWPELTIEVRSAWLNGTDREAALLPPTPGNQGRALTVRVLQDGVPRNDVLGLVASLAVRAGAGWVQYTNVAYVYMSVRPVNCQANVDILFVADASGSIGSSHWMIETNFISNVISFFDIGHNLTRAAFIRFGSSASVIFDFDDSYDGGLLQSMVTGTPYTGGGTNTANALTLAQSLFTSARGARPLGVPKICVLVTDGNSNSRSATIAAATALKNVGVTMFAIGAGTGISTIELNAVASAPTADHVYMISSIVDIDALTSVMASSTCDTPGQISPGGTFAGTLSPERLRYFVVSCPELGAVVNISLRVSHGTAQLYVSATESNPGPYDNDLYYLGVSGVFNVSVNRTLLSASDALYFSVGSLGSGVEVDFSIEVDTNVLAPFDGMSIAIPADMPSGSAIALPLDTSSTVGNVTSFWDMIPGNISDLSCSSNLTWSLVGPTHGLAIDNATGTLSIVDSSSLPAVYVEVTVRVSGPAASCVRGQATIGIQRIGAATWIAADLCTNYLDLCGPRGGAENMSQCLASVSLLGAGADTDVAGDTLGCRSYYMQAALSGLTPLNVTDICSASSIADSPVCAHAAPEPVGVADADNGLCMASLTYDFSHPLSNLNAVPHLSSSPVQPAMLDVSGANGGPSRCGGGASACGWQYFNGSTFRFSAGSGIAIPQIGSILNASYYTLRVKFSFDTANYLQRIYNVYNASNSGLYTRYSSIYPYGYSSSLPFTANTDTDLFVVVNRTQLTVYVSPGGAVPSQTFAVTSSYYDGYTIVDSEMLFFNDVGLTCATGGETANGSVSLVQVWNDVLPAETIAAMKRGCNSTGHVQPEVAPAPGVVNPSNRLCRATLTYDFTTNASTLGPVPALSESTDTIYMRDITQTELHNSACGTQGLNGSAFVVSSGDGLYLPGLSQAITNDTVYTIRMKFSSAAYRYYYLPLIVPNQLYSSYGLMTYYSQFRLYPIGSSFSNIVPGVDYDIVMVVNYSTVSLYVSAPSSMMQSVTVPLSSYYRAYFTLGDSVSFFNSAQQCVASTYNSGALQYVQVYDRALESEEVQGVLEHGCGPSGIYTPPPNYHDGPGVANPANKLCSAWSTYDFTTGNSSLAPVMSLSEAAAPPTLVDIADVASCSQPGFNGSTFRFGDGVGLALPGAAEILNQTSYSVRFRFSMLENGRYQRLLNVNNRSDYGLYTYYNSFRAYPVSTSTAGFASDTKFDLVLVVSGSDVSLYLNAATTGFVRTTFSMTASQMAGYRLATDLVFFNDRGSVCSSGSEDAPGSVDYIQVWNKSLSPCEVQTHMQGCSVELPTTQGPSTTVAPSTSSTSAPGTLTTTIAPSTAAPSTIAPSTASPSTIAPSTVTPTTASPSVSPTTVSPSTIAPSTEAPVTAPTTGAPTFAECSGCLDGTKGPCISSVGICFPISGDGLTCPPASILCSDSTAPTASPTYSPADPPHTAAPTSTPTSLAPTTAPPTPLPCPTNCGSVALGGGTCRLGGPDRNITQCTSCNPTRVLLSGRCLQAINCRGNRVRSGPLVGVRCRCNDTNCFYCRQTPGSDICTKCRNGFYLLGTTCHASCPANMTHVGISTFNRYCAPAPFNCVSNRVTIDGETQVCKCPQYNVMDSPLGNCHNCTFQPGGFGGWCNTCRNSKFLYNGTCSDDCSAAPSTLVAYDIGSYGRSCRSPFTCADQRDGEGNRCKCPVSIGGANCRQCDWAIGGTECTACKNNRFLHMGVCVSRCPAPFTPVIPLIQPSRGRTCQSPP